MELKEATERLQKHQTLTIQKAHAADWMRGYLKGALRSKSEEVRRFATVAIQDWAWHHPAMEGLPESGAPTAETCTCGLTDLRAHDGDPRLEAADHDPACGEPETKEEA